MSDPSPPKKRRLEYSSKTSINTSMTSSMSSQTGSQSQKTGGSIGKARRDGGQGGGETKSRLPPAPCPLPEKAAEVMPHDVVENMLRVACAKGIMQAGFTGWTPMAGERVLEMVEERILSFTKLIHRSMTASRRIRPAPDDFIFAIPDWEKTIEQEAEKTRLGQIPTHPPPPSKQPTTPPITPPSPSNLSVPAPPPAPARKRKRTVSLPPPAHPPLLLTPPSSPMFNPPTDKKFLAPGPPPQNAKLPRFLPSMPPAHTYKFTPTYIREFGTADNRAARERVREEARKGEKALRSLILQIQGAQKKEDGKEEERLGKRKKEREEGWREAFEKICGGEEDATMGVAEGKKKKKKKEVVEVLPEPVNWERDRYWRKVARKGGFGSGVKG